ncbi:MAG: hypothetical protein R3F43_08255 [bacterium]
MLASLPPEADFTALAAWRFEAVGDARFREGEGVQVAVSPAGFVTLAWRRCGRVDAGCSAQQDAVVFAWQADGEWTREVVEPGGEGLCGEDVQLAYDGEGAAVTWRCSRPVGDAFEFVVEGATGGAAVRAWLVAAALLVGCGEATPEPALRGSVGALRSGLRRHPRPARPERARGAVCRPGRAGARPARAARSGDARPRHLDAAGGGDGGRRPRRPAAPALLEGQVELDAYDPSPGGVVAGRFQATVEGATPWWGRSPPRTGRP